MQRFHHAAITRAACFLLAASAVAASAQDLKTTDQIVDFAESKTTGYKTWSADYSQNMSMFGTHMSVNGSVVQKTPHRVWMQLDMPIMGQHSQMTMVMGQDGIMWQVMKMGTQQQIMKMDMNKLGSNVLAQAGAQGNPLDQFDPSKQLETTRGMCDLNIGATVNLEGQPMYVLEGGLKQSALTNSQLATMAATVGKTRVFIGKTDGFVHRLEQYDKSQTNMVMAMEFKNLKFNQDVPDSTFAYQPPPDAQVVDMTQMMQQRSQQPSGGDDAAPGSPPHYNVDQQRVPDGSAPPSTPPPPVQK
jgi:outer membrane lipoprotein-sorting protein